MRTRPRRLVAIAASLLAMAAAGHARADDDRSDARAAYDDAARAYEAREFLRAAEGFARADTLAPNALALKLALAAAVQADAPVLAEELALRAESRDASPDVQELARNGHRIARDRVGKIEIVCVRAPCVASVGGREVRGGQSVIAARGRATVSFTASDGRVVATTVDVPPNATVRAVEQEPPPAFAVSEPPATPRERDGLSPVVFWIGAGVTAALAGATIGSGLDANARYDDFASARTVATQQDGKSAELRTNILLGSTIVVALVTGALGIWRTRWADRYSAAR